MDKPLGDMKIAGIVLAGGRSSRMGQDKALLKFNGAPLIDHMIGLLERSGLADIYVSGDIEGYRCIPDSAPHEGPARAIMDVLAALDGYDGVLFVPVDMPLLTPELLQHLLETSLLESVPLGSTPLPSSLLKPPHAADFRGAYFESHPFPLYTTQLSRDGLVEEARGVREVEGGDLVGEDGAAREARRESSAVEKIGAMMRCAEGKNGASGEKAGSVKALLSALGVFSIALPPAFEQCMAGSNTPEEWAEVLRA